MHLANASIKNFRGIEDLTATFSSGLNVVVGRNNIGKTNLLTAIMHALGPSAVRGESLWIDKDDFHIPSRGTEPRYPISIHLTFQGLTEADRTTFFEIVEFNLDQPELSEAHVHFQATWERNRARVERWAGRTRSDGTQIPAGVLEAIPVTFLPALRDAELALAPGRKSRLARLLADLAGREHKSSKDAIQNIFNIANENLLQDALVKAAKDTISESTKSMSGTDYSEAGIAAAEADFERILRTLSIQMAKGPTSDIHLNGLGYNNLLYIAVVLTHLNSIRDEDSPLLLVEEPEAHLHPQLTTLLGKHLAESQIQTLITTHSPVLASSVAPEKVSVFHQRHTDRKLVCPSLSRSGMNARESNALQRMLDVTKATLYFAKGIILVEGISEALLLPVLAERWGKPLQRHHISVIPIAGVAFETFEKLLSENTLSIPVAIITDADPEVVSGNTWEQDRPKKENGCFTLSDRTQKLIELFKDGHSVQVFHSEVTLEYDLAAAACGNGDAMALAWRDCFDGIPQTFTAKRLEDAGTDLEARALCAWRGICRSTTTGSKAKFAQNLAYHLTTDGVEFTTPGYILNAISFVVGSPSGESPQPQGDEEESQGLSTNEDKMPTNVDIGGETSDQ